MLVVKRVCKELEGRGNFAIPSQYISPFWRGEHITVVTQKILEKRKSFTEFYEQFSESLFESFYVEQWFPTFFYAAEHY